MLDYYNRRNNVDDQDYYNLVPYLLKLIDRQLADPSRTLYIEIPKSLQQPEESQGSNLANSSFNAAYNQP
jgi:hypothetical protein